MTAWKKLILNKKKPLPPKTPKKRPSKAPAPKGLRLGKWAFLLLIPVLAAGLWYSPVPLPTLGLEASWIESQFPGAMQGLDYKKSYWQKGSLYLEKAQIKTPDLQSSLSISVFRVKPSLKDLILMHPLHFNFELGTVKWEIVKDQELHKSIAILFGALGSQNLQKWTSTWQQIDIQSLELKSQSAWVQISELQWQSRGQSELRFAKYKDFQGLEFSKFSTIWNAKLNQFEKIQGLWLGSSVKGHLQIHPDQNRPLELGLYLADLNLNPALHFFLGQGQFEGSGDLHLDLKGKIWPLMGQAQGSALLSAPYLSIRNLNLQNSIQLSRMAPDLQMLSLSNFRLQLSLQNPAAYRFQIQAVNQGDLSLSGIYRPKSKNVQMSYTKSQVDASQTVQLQGSMATESAFP